MFLVNVPVYTLAAGGMQLLDSSHNSSGMDASLMSHLKCNLRLKKGSRHLLLGRNGCGKTTLLRAIASGSFEGWPQDLRVQLVHQDVPVDTQLSPMDMVLGSDSERLALKKEMAELEELCETCEDEGRLEVAGLRLCEIYEILEDSDDGQHQRHAREILGGLGFSKDMVDTPLRELSGGWRVRAMIAAALFMEPDLLLLDEPTNHLDLAAITWLQNHLVNDFPGTVLCVSHDRYFINAFANEIIVFAEDRSLKYFSGNLDDLYRHAEKIARRGDRQDGALQKQMQQIQKKAEKMELRIEKMESGFSSNAGNKRYGAYQCMGATNIDKASAQAKKDQKKLEVLRREADGQGPEALDPVSLQIVESNDDSWAAELAPSFDNTDSALKFAFTEAEPLNLPRDIPLLALNGVSYQYLNAEENVLSNVDISITERDRIAVTGKNGVGKSTLVNLLIGTLVPSSGDVMRHQNLRIAHFGQHDAEKLQAHRTTPLQYLEECFPKILQRDLCMQLAAFGITEKLMQQPMAELSGGQRMRVAFARMCAEEPHLLILDEPTNHLDVYTIEALCDALKDFKGAVVFVTHNRYLIEEAADSMLVVGAQGIKVERASLINKQRFILDT